MILSTKADLLAVAARRPPTEACATALKEGRATVLGGFAPAQGFPYWLLRVTSRRGSEWLIAVECDEVHQRYLVTYRDRVSAQDWIGQSNGRRPLIDGETPALMAFQRMQAKRRK